MLVTAFAPTFLNPVGHEKLSCTGSSLIFRFRPSPVRSFASDLTAMDGGNAGFAGSKNPSSRPDLTVKPLPFASSYRLITTWFSTVIFLQGTFTPLVHAHAGRTQIAPSDTYCAALFVHFAALYFKHKNPSAACAAEQGVSVPSNKMKVLT
jgi:hypothetical protein